MFDRLLLPAYTLWWREMVRFYRQGSRVVGTLVTPLVFWLFLGAGFGTSFRAAAAPAGVGYLEYFYPGTLALIVLFTSIFSTISIIEDRKEGFLQSVLVAPVAPAAIVLGKVLGGATIALVQGSIFLVLAPTLGIPLDAPRVLTVMAVLFLIAVGMTALGFCLAWRSDSVQGFHAVLNLFLMPMWFLSEAAFPASGAPAWLQAPMRVNPLTYGVAGLRRGLYPDWPAAADVPGLAFSLGVLVLFAAVLFALAVRALAPRRIVPRPATRASSAGIAAQAVLWSVLGLVLAAIVGSAIWQWLGSRDAAQAELPTAPEFTLVERSGRPFPSARLAGKVWIADFVFTHCAGPCPMMSGVMARLQKDLPATVHLVSFSVDPERDTPAVLTEYADRLGADPARWFFLTGERDTIYPLVVEGFHLPVQQTGGDPRSAVLHSEKFLLVDAKGRVHGYYDALEEPDLARLAADATRLARITLLPAFHATLNSASFVLLFCGWLFIRKKKVTAHKSCMLAAFAVSCVFLGSYLFYHYHAGSTPFLGEGWSRPMYFTLLLTHTVLAALVVPLAVATLFRAARGEFDLHKKIARWTLPVWLYVAATGVLVYFVLYHWFAPS